MLGSRKPLLRWAGSKRRLVPILATFWGAGFARYVEPFAGSACLFFALNPPRAVLGDLNADLIATYSTIKRNATSVHVELQKIPLGRTSYYVQRGTDVSTLTEHERAARFIFLNRYCFNGLYRTNLLGEFNVPYSPRKTGELPSLCELLAVAKRLRSARLIKADFERSVAITGEGDFIYADPPYASREQRVFREYCPGSFRVNDIGRLAQCLDSAVRRGASAVVTYADSVDFRDAFSGWKISAVQTQRNISGFAKHRKTTTELIASKSA